MFLEPKERVKKLVSVLAISTLVIISREKTVEIARIIETVEASKDSEGGE